MKAAPKIEKKRKRQAKLHLIIMKCTPELNIIVCACFWFPATFYVIRFVRCANFVLYCAVFRFLFFFFLVIRWWRMSVCIPTVFTQSLTLY